MDPAQLQDFKKMMNRCVPLDQLIELVKNQPVIWDKTVNGYRNKDYCTVAWDGICRDLVGNEIYEVAKSIILKLVKQKWTQARDVWQRTYKKRREAIQNGEHLPDMKDNARYEKLKFLEKVYDIMDHSAQDEKVMDLDDFENPPSPLVEPNGENLPNNVDFTKTLLEQAATLRSFFMNAQNFHKPNVSPQSKKLESNVEPSAHLKNDQINASNRTVVVNLDDSFKVGSLLSANKNRSSSVDKRDDDKSSCSMKSPKREQNTSNFPPLNSNTHSVKNSPGQSAQKVEPISPGQLIKEEDNSVLSASGDTTSSKVRVTSDLKRKVEENEQTPRKKSCNGRNSLNNQTENFLQVLKPQIEDFSKSQMMDFFFKILKPLINGFDKHRLLDFQIEALQLIKKIEGNNENNT